MIAQSGIARNLLRIFGAIFCISELLFAEEDLSKIPVPKATPVEDLLPRFGEREAVISFSEQFQIRGGDAASRGLAANIAEEAKGEILAIFEQKDEWKVPIFISLKGREGDPVPLRDTVLLPPTFNDQGYRLELYVHLSQGLRPVPLKRAITEALIFSFGVQDLPRSETSVDLQVPVWVTEGLYEAMNWYAKKSDRKLYEALFRHGGLFKLDDLFSLNPNQYLTIDAASRTAFRVSSGALMMALIEQPEGKSSISHFLTELVTFQGEIPSLLRKHFPDLNLSESSLEKWWALQLASKGAAELSESFTVVETDRKLSEALILRYRDKEGLLKEIPIEQWEALFELEDVYRKDALFLAEQEIQRLSYRCFPSYRSLLIEYQIVLGDLAKMKNDNVASSLEALASSRATMLSKVERARDFLDYFEISRAREMSGEFDDYLKLKARLKNTSSPRTDPITQYMDRLAPLFDVPTESRNDRLDFSFPTY